MQNIIVVINNSHSSIYNKILNKIREFHPGIQNINPIIEKYDHSIYRRKYMYQNTIVYEIYTIFGSESSTLPSLEKLNLHDCCDIVTKKFSHYDGTVKTESIDIFKNASYFYYYGFYEYDELCILARLEYQVKHFENFILIDHIESKLNMDDFFKFGDKFFFNQFVKTCNNIQALDDSDIKKRKGEPKEFNPKDHAMITLNMYAMEMNSYISNVRNELIRKHMKLKSLCDTVNNMK